MFYAKMLPVKFDLGGFIGSVGGSSAPVAR